MGRKPKFKPIITRVKLNPEQAVLSCDCWTQLTRWLATNYTARSGSRLTQYCTGTAKQYANTYPCNATGGLAYYRSTGGSASS